MSTFNPNAKSWTPSVSAPEWKPSGAHASTNPFPSSNAHEQSSPPLASTTPSVASKQSVSSSVSPQVPANASVYVDAPEIDIAGSRVNEVIDNEGGDIDPNDPLWQAVLKICNGDNEKAMKMIENPDSLSEYPEIVKLLERESNDDLEDWEQEQTAELDRLTIENSDVQSDRKNEVDTDSSPVQSMKDDGEKQLEEAVSKKKNSKEELEAIEGDPREHINIVFIGHVDAGKSTLSGNILYLTDNVDQRTIEKYEREAKERNRESWFLAFIMDTSDEERAKGKTVEVGKAHFETELKRYTILDAPGHKNYVPNMIMGASQADVGVLVISARKGEFETGFDRGGQTREHAMLAKTLGVTYLVVVINKMDDPTVNWSKARYDECVQKLKPFLKSCGFTIKREVKFIPISGLNGANVKDVVDSSACPWWAKSVSKGENNTNISTLISLLDSLEMKNRDANAALRIPVLDRYNDRGTIAMGKVESGTIRPGQKIIVMPTRNEYKVDSVWANETPVVAATPGENVLVKLTGCGVEDVLKGFVICTKPPCRAVDKIICQIALLDMPENTRIFTAGFSMMFHSHCCEEECTVSKIFETTNSKGQVNKNVMFATVGMRVICMLELSRSVSVERYDDFPCLGRITLRGEGKTLAIGKIIKLPPKKE